MKTCATRYKFKRDIKNKFIKNKCQIKQSTKFHLPTIFKVKILTPH